MKYQMAWSSCFGIVDKNKFINNISQFRTFYHWIFILFWIVEFHLFTRMNDAYRFLFNTLLQCDTSELIWTITFLALFSAIQWTNTISVSFCSERTIKIHLGHIICSQMNKRSCFWSLIHDCFVFQVYENEYKYGTNFKCKICKWVWIASQEHKFVT